MLKHQLGYRRVRYRGLEQNAFDVCLMLTACNLKRALWLGREIGGNRCESCAQESMKYAVAAR